MSGRDRAFRGFDTIYLVAPLSARVLEGLPAAVERSSIREGLRSHGDAAALPVRLPDDADDARLIVSAREAGRFLGFAIAGDRVAITIAHERADGVEGTRIVAALLADAAGREGAGSSPATSFALARALRTSGFPAVRAYLQGRAGRRALPDPGTATEAGPGRFARITLDPVGVAALRRTRSAGGRATPMTRAASIALTALTATAPAGIDARVVVPMDLRHLVGAGRVAGNFVSAEAYGTLRGTDWSPASLSRMLAERRASGAVALAASSVRALLPKRGSAVPRPTVSISLMGTIAMPDGIWDGGPAVVSCATVGRSPGTFAFVAQVDRAITVSVWDDTGAFDVDRFPAEFRIEMDRRSAV